MNTVKGLSDFCKKHRVSVPAGDKFSLLDFVLEISKRAVPLAEYKGKVSEIINRLGNESEEWGGCPNCGSNVHLGLAECPVCGNSLDFVEPELEANDLTDLDPDYATAKKVKPEDLDDIADELEEDESDDESFDDDDEISDEDSDEVDEIEEDDESDSDDEDTSEDESDDEGIEETSDDEDDVESEEDDEDIEPLSGPKKAVSNGRPFLSKRANVSKPTTVHAEKFAERQQRRKKLESLIPKFKKDPNLIMKLKYEHLLVMPGLLGYVGKPTTIGSKADIQRWVRNALKGGLKK